MVVSVNEKSAAPAVASSPRGLYVHVPFCLHRCWYCDFAVVTGQESLADRYLDALAAEWERQRASVPGPVRLSTLFIGGGTPTQLEPALLTRMLANLRRAGDWTPDVEVSIEANPEGFTLAKLDALVQGGVTRISLGGQSFHPRHLHFLERQHAPGDLVAAIQQVQRAGLRVAVDLIFGIPGQTLDDWRGDLQAVLDLGVEHVSTYGLTFEKGTRLWKARAHGQVEPIANEVEAQMYELAMARLPTGGLVQYELSNFARPGEQCRHNEVYWANEPYFGIGLGAARYLVGTRAVNTRSLATYLQRCLARDDPVQSAETLEPQERARETAMLNLRRVRGIDRAAFAAQTGYRLDDLLGATLPRLVSQGLLADAGPTVALTPAGRLLADEVMGQVLVPT